MEKNEEKSEPIGNLKNLSSSAKEYMDMHIDSFKLRMVESLSQLFSKIVYTLILIVILGIAAAFIASALSWFLGDLLNSRIAGTLITAGIFILLAVVIVLRRKKLLLDSMVKMFIPLFFEPNNLTDKEEES
ncbi:MAG: phage holin family protein [Bacteroidales bacterium]